MKTVFIWDELQGELQFFVVEGDFRHLNNTYINSVEDEDKQDELNKILAYDNEGKPEVTMLTEFPIQEVKDGAYVVVAGFLP